MRSATGAFVMNRPDNRPHPQQVQVPNPLWQVDSREEMEGLLDFSVPVLDKAVEALWSLTQGDRLVGIISHVDTLRQRIDRQIRVTKLPGGGSVASVQP